MLRRKSAGSFVDVADLKRKASGSWTTVSALKRKDAGVWVTVWPLPPGIAASIDDQEITTAGGTGATASVAYRIDSDGSVYGQTGAGSFVAIETWLDTGANTDFEVRFTVASSNGIGALTGTLGTWLATTSDNTLQLNSAPAGFTAARTITVEIRAVATGIVLAAATITLEAERL